MKLHLVKALVQITDRDTNTGLLDAEECEFNIWDDLEFTEGDSTILFLRVVKNAYLAQLEKHVLPMLPTRWYVDAVILSVTPLKSEDLRTFIQSHEKDRYYSTL